MPRANRYFCKAMSGTSHIAATKKNSYLNLQIAALELALIDSAKPLQNTRSVVQC